MKRLTNFFSEWIFLGTTIAIIGLIFTYIIGVFCLPVAIIWAIYKLVTHFIN